MIIKLFPESSNIRFNMRRKFVMSHRQWTISSTGTEISGHASSTIVTLFASRILLRLGSRAVHEFSEPISRRVFVTYARSRSQNTNKLARP